MPKQLCEHNSFFSESERNMRQFQSSSPLESVLRRNNLNILASLGSFQYYIYKKVFCWNLLLFFGADGWFIIFLLGIFQPRIRAPVDISREPKRVPSLHQVYLVIHFSLDVLALLLFGQYSKVLP